MSNMNDTVVDIILQYGGIDGGHHKMWVIDQILRMVTGPAYDNVIEDYENDGEYEWDVGIAP